jgi:hypothetical protein
LTFGIYYKSKSHIYQNYLVTEIFNVRGMARSRMAHEEKRALQHASQVQIHQKRQYGLKNVLALFFTGIWALHCNERAGDCR